MITAPQCLVRGARSRRSGQIIGELAKLARYPDCVQGCIGIVPIAKCGLPIEIAALLQKAQPAIEPLLPVGRGDYIDLHETADHLFQHHHGCVVIELTGHPYPHISIADSLALGIGAYNPADGGVIDSEALQ